MDALNLIFDSFQAQLNKREAELQQALNKVETEVSARATIQKQAREVEGLLQEAQEDLEQEKESRSRAEKQKRDLSEVCQKIFACVSKSQKFYFLYATLVPMTHL